MGLSADRPAGSAGALWRLGADERGQVLILTGVLLVLGFVVVGSTIIQMQALDEATARLERTAITQPTEEVIGNFERAIQHTVPAGHTNKTDFFERVRSSQALLKDSAVRSGLYVAADLDVSPDPAFLLAHCGGYDHTKSQDGMVMGYLKDDLRESIVGAVYLMHVTDGARTMRWHHYVQIHECSDATINTFPAEVTMDLGSTVGELAYVTSNDDGNAALGLKEQLTGTIFVPATPGFAVDLVNTVNWVPTNGADDDGGLAVSHTGALVVDKFAFRVNVPEDMLVNQVADSVVLRLDLSHTPQAVGQNDDVLKLTRKYAGQPDQTWNIAVTTVEQSFNIVAPSPTGNGHWTYDELRDATWELWVDELDAKDATRVYKLDYVMPTVTYTTPQGYQVDATFTWTKIPTLYHLHEVSLVYKITPGTAGEQFDLEVYNDVTGAWDLAATLSDTAGLWVPIPVHTLVDPDQYNANIPLFRIRDASGWVNDNGGSDQDTIEIDFLTLQSQANNQP